MQIKKQGLRYQLLRSVNDPARGRRVQVLVGSFLISTENLKDVPDAVMKKLRPNEWKQLQAFFEERKMERKLQERRRYLERVPDVMTEAARAMRSIKKADEKETQPLLDTFNELMEAFAEDGYAVNILPVTLKETAKSLKHWQVSPEEAAAIFMAWLELKRALAKEGFTARWYKDYTNQE